MRTLVALKYSPWSEKARWALDHHRVAYRFEEYVPMLGEPRLRMRVGSPFAKVSVPVLFEDGRVITDSFAIARRAEEIGGGPSSLFPSERAAAIEAWNRISEDALSAGRTLLMGRLRDRPEARLGSLPGFFPRWLRPLLGPVASMGVAFVARKYRASAADLSDCRRRLVGALDELRAGLNGGEYVFGALTYADLAMAVVMQFVSPVSDVHIALEPATRDAWRDDALSSSYDDLVGWRDVLYRRHRRA